MSNLRHAVRDAKDLPAAVEVILAELDRVDRTSAHDLDELLGQLHAAYEQHLARTEKTEPTVVGIGC